MSSSLPNPPPALAVARHLPVRILTPSSPIYYLSLSLAEVPSESPGGAWFDHFTRFLFQPLPGLTSEQVPAWDAGCCQKSVGRLQAGARPPILPGQRKSLPSSVLPKFQLAAARYEAGTRPGCRPCVKPPILPVSLRNRPSFRDFNSCCSVTSSPRTLTLKVTEFLSASQEPT